MNMRIKVLALLTALFIFLVAGAGLIYPAIKERDADIIKVAFMNGYLAALKLSDDDLKKIKGDEALLKQTVEKAANNYLALINSMNTATQENK